MKDPKCTFSLDATRLRLCRSSRCLGPCLGSLGSSGLLLLQLPANRATSQHCKRARRSGNLLLVRDLNMHVKACRGHPCLASAASFLALRRGTAMPSMHCSLRSWLSTPQHNQRLSERVICKTFQSMCGIKRAVQPCQQQQQTLPSSAPCTASSTPQSHPERSVPEISEGTDVRTPHAAQQPQPSSAEAWHHIWLVWPAQPHRWLL